MAGKFDIKVKGGKNILKNFKLSDKNLERGIAAGLIDATAYIESKSNEIAPRRFGFLRISSFTTDIDKKRTVQVGRVGYEAEYAPFVHEMPETYNYTTAGTGPKFLEKAVKNNPRNIIATFTRTVTRILASWQ